MAKNKSKSVDYRAIKKFLNPFYKFSFNMPAKGRDFKPQQKAVLTKIFNKIAPLIERIAYDKQSFLKYPKGSKLPNIDGVRTNKGLFYKFPSAQVVKAKLYDTLGRPYQAYTVYIKHKNIREVFIPFTKNIVNDINEIKDFVQQKSGELDPDYIMWGKSGLKSRSLYAPDAFDLYITEMQMDKDDKKIEYALKNFPTYNGVFFGYIL